MRYAPGKSARFFVFSAGGTAGTVQEGAEFALEVTGQQVTGKAVRTGGWADYKVVELGQIEIKQRGPQVVKVRARDPQTWKAINLRWVRFAKAE